MSQEPKNDGCMYEYCTMSLQFVKGFIVKKAGAYHIISQVLRPALERRGECRISQIVTLMLQHCITTCYSHRTIGNPLGEWSEATLLTLW